MPTKSEQTAKARWRRAHPTTAQIRLRQVIQKHGDRLKRQVLIGRSLIHFALPDRNLLINVFGEQLQRDASQTERLNQWLVSIGFCYLELSNKEVLESPDNVVQAIESFPECLEANQSHRAAKRIARKFELSTGNDSVDDLKIDYDV